ncbi:GSCOCG00012220001-RA-CDS [Cotesia congregata]|nr:GSCOCG00012220001-RA-CDS [Cotesia congregata]
MRLTTNSKGPDGFEIKVYKILLPYFLCIITELFNLSLSTGDFPFSDYRPISLLCTLSKALERCVHDQIASYLAIHDLEDKYQTAFRP